MRLNIAFRSDLAWWQQFLETWKGGLHAGRVDLQPPDVNRYTDAADELCRALPGHGEGAAALHCPPTHGQARTRHRQILSGSDSVRADSPWVGKPIHAMLQVEQVLKGVKKATPASSRTRLPITPAILRVLRRVRQWEANQRTAKMRWAAACLCVAGFAVIGHASDRTRLACARYVLIVVLVGDLHCFLAHRFTGGVGPVGARL